MAMMMKEIDEEKERSGKYRITKERNDGGRRKREERQNNAGKE